MSAAGIEIVRDPTGWRAALAEIPAHDFYHSYDYHKISFGYPGASSCLLSYRDGELRVALPLLLREGSVGGVEFVDATSVYGYAGPVANFDRVQPDQISRLQDALRDSLSSLSVVTLFSRLHPLLDHSAALKGLGEVVEAGSTVSIDLRRPEAEQWRGYRSNRRREVAALRDSEMLCERTDLDEDYQAFLELYAASMRRKNASEAYLLDDEGLEQLRRAQDFQTELFVCKLGGEIVAAGLFVRCQGIVQYHLSGTHANYYALAPTKLLLDTVRRWASNSGCRVLHLGGGLGGQRDSLFSFKRGFSRDLQPFRLWKWVLDDSAYGALTSAHRTSPCGFFPAYRTPTS